MTDSDRSPARFVAQRTPVAPAADNERPLKYTMCVTQRCNLACRYCYAVNGRTMMSLETGRRVVDFVFQHAPKGRRIDLGFFGGEPLLAFPLIQAITGYVKAHPAYSPDRFQFSLTTNGTVLTDRIVAFLEDNRVNVCVSCDGAPDVHDAFRPTSHGNGSAERVASNLRRGVRELSRLVVNAVYHPQTFRRLPASVAYLSSLGVRHIYLNPDFSAPWTQADATDLLPTYRAIGEQYCTWYRNGEPHFVSLIDSKITTLLRGGYQPCERCQMGQGEMAFSVDGGIYPCERLIGGGTDEHRIGDVSTGLDLTRLTRRRAPGDNLNPECLGCSLRDLCVNWCGCSNAFMSGFYNRVGPFQCASERAAIQVALEVFTALEHEYGSAFAHHVCGAPHANNGSGREAIRPASASPILRSA